MYATAQNPEQDTEIIKTVIKWQLIVFIIIAMAIKLVVPTAFKSAMYGSLVALLNSSFLYWRMRQAHRATGDSAAACLRRVQRAAMERFVLIAFLLAVGMSTALRLLPLAVLASFLIGQLAFLLGVAVSARKQVGTK